MIGCDVKFVFGCATPPTFASLTFHEQRTKLMTVSTPPAINHHPAKRKYGIENGFDPNFTSSPSPNQDEISPRVIKKLRPKLVTAQSMRSNNLSPFPCLIHSQDSISLIPRSKKL